jgi:hypothetical protein
MNAGPGLRLLEGVTAAVLLLVIASLGGMVWAAYRPQWEPAATEVQVIGVLALLLAALVLVSALALWQTRR